MIKQTYHNRGFTLVETIVTIAIFTLLIYGITFLISGILTSSGFQSRVLDNNDQARKTASTFANEVRGAVTSATGSFPIESAGNQQIIFYTKTSTSVVRTRYFLQNGSLYKGVTSPSGNPAIYNLATESVILVQPAMATGPSDAIFTYYDGNGNVLASPVNVTQVRNIQVTLKIYLQGSRNNINTYTVTASASVRNLKDNL